MHNYKQIGERVVDDQFTFVNKIEVQQDKNVIDYGLFFGFACLYASCQY